MIGFNYIYKDSQEILASVSHLSSINSLDIFLWALAWLITLFSIFILFPSIIIIYEYHKDTITKKNKKKILSQILLQKEIEDEVEQEIDIEKESKVL